MSFHSLPRRNAVGAKNGVSEPTQRSLPYSHDKPAETGIEPTPSAPSGSVLRNPPLCEASARVAQASFTVAALSGILDTLGEGYDPVRDAIWKAVAVSCDDLLRAQKILQAVRDITEAPCPYCGALSSRARRPRTPTTTPNDRPSSVGRTENVQPPSSTRTPQCEKSRSSPGEKARLPISESA